MAPLFSPGYLLLRDAVSTPRSYLSDSALGLSQARSQQLVAQNHATAAARDMAVSAAQQPDPCIRYPQATANTRKPSQRISKRQQGSNTPSEAQRAQEISTEPND
ncbi:MAG: hypothetical protein ACPGIJ_06965, partial [Mycobacterium sp.]